VSEPFGVADSLQPGAVDQRVSAEHFPLAKLRPGPKFWEERERRVKTFAGSGRLQTVALPEPVSDERCETQA